MSSYSEQLDLLSRSSVAASPSHVFGGTWTSEKLQVLTAYLEAYQTALKKQNFRTIYIDAFAGSGYISLAADGANMAAGGPQALFPEFADEGAERFIAGSAKLALSIRNPFDEYIFIEQSRNKAAELNKLRTQFPDLANSIRIQTGDANEQILNLCHKVNWKRSRAVLFLDPYGMQVKWSTLASIAKTEAIDLWYLFPLGVGVNRLLTKSADISSAHQMKLDEIFGTSDWKNCFYRADSQLSLLGNTTAQQKVADFDMIEGLIVERMKTVFAKVAERPLRLYNQKGNPLYSFCFAASNPGKGGALGLKLANYFLLRKSRWHRGQQSNGRK